MERIARVFITRTSMTPDDDLAYINCPPPLALPEISAVHISVTFTWDIPRAELLARQWEAAGAPVQIGGPAYDSPGNEFVPGLYLRRRMIITSRGCPNACWFCAVPRREGALRELPIREGWNVLDDNLLACGENHIRAVFAMLGNQEQRPVFSGGLEAARLLPWHAEALRVLRPRRMYFAFDTADDYEPLVEAGKTLRAAGHTVSSHTLCCYCLVGYPGDTFEAAGQRLENTIRAGFMPFAMLYRDQQGETSREWRKFQREWIRPEIVGAKMKTFWKQAQI